ncbi:MAG: hypothetical protein ACJ72U_15645 [Nitrososphaeraceae archaeon]
MYKQNPRSNIIVNRTFIKYVVLQKRNKDSKEVAEDGIEQSIDNEDIESIQVAGEGEAKGAATAERSII